MPWHRQITEVEASAGKVGLRRILRRRRICRRNGVCGVAAAKTAQCAASRAACQHLLVDKHDREGNHRATALLTAACRLAHAVRRRRWDWNERSRNITGASCCRPIDGEGVSQNNVRQSHHALPESHGRLPAALAACASAGCTIASTSSGLCGLPSTPRRGRGLATRGRSQGLRRRRLQDAGSADPSADVLELELAPRSQ